MPAYRHIFFDLDHTLWDFHKNSEETLHELYHAFNLPALGAKNATAFIETYKEINHRLWDGYHNGTITKEQLRHSRFRNAFTACGINGEHIADDFGNEYLHISPTKPHLLPNALRVLEYLSAKYTMSIITNGFAEVQFVKLKHARIEHFFSHVFISETIGYQKPDVRIFEHATRTIGVKPSHTMMVGDNFATDIVGAIQAGIDHIYFNPAQTPHNLSVQKEIFDLHELMSLL